MLHDLLKLQVEAIFDKIGMFYDLSILLYLGVTTWFFRKFRFKNFRISKNWRKKFIKFHVGTLAIQPWGRFLSNSSFNESEYSSSTLITSRAFDWLVVSVSDPDPSCDWLSCSISSASSFVNPSDPSKIILRFSPPDQLHLK